MTATLEVRAPAPAPGRPRPAVATGALARIEALRLARHPLVLLAALAVLAIWLLPTLQNQPAARFPLLSDQDRETHWPMMLLAVATMVAANLGALRSHRHRAEPAFGVCALPRWRRTLAHLLAVGAPVALALLLILVRCVQWALTPMTAGRPAAAELLTGPMVVALGGVVGVLLATVVRSVFVAPLIPVLVALPILRFSGGMAGGEPSRWRWLSPIVDESLFEPWPASLVHRPAGWHLLYLAGLALLLAVAALTVTGAPRRAGFLAALAAGVVALAAGGSVQIQSTPDSVRDARVVAAERASTIQRCRSIGNRTYCAFDGWSNWIPEWDRVVTEVTKPAPASVATAPLTVRQQIVLPAGNGVVDENGLRERFRADNARAGTPRAAPVGTTWGPEPTRLDLAIQVSDLLVGWEKPTDFDQRRCDARRVVSLWLAARALDRPTDLAMVATTGQLSGGGPDDSLWIAAGGIASVTVDANAWEVTKDALRRPAAEIQAILRTHWAELVTPGTPVARAAELFGVPAGTPRPIGENSDVQCQ